MNEFTKYQIAGLLDAPATGKLLYLLLLDIVDADGKITIPQRRISEALGISKSTVSHNFRKLYNRGYINIVPQFHIDGGRAANKYSIWD